MSENLYAPPKAQLDPNVDPEQAARVEDRRRHIHAEHSVRGLGSLWMFAGGVAGLWAVVTAGVALVDAVTGGRPLERALSALATSTVVAVFGAGFLALGLSQRRLEAWTWLPALCLCAAMLLGAPFGTLLGGYYLVLLLSGRGRRVFKPDYPELIAATPEVRRATPALVWAALLCVIALGVAALFIH